MTPADLQRMSWYQRDRLYLRSLAEMQADRREVLAPRSKRRKAVREHTDIPTATPPQRARIYKRNGAWYVQLGDVETACTTHTQAIEYLGLIGARA